MSNLPPGTHEGHIDQLSEACCTDCGMSFEGMEDMAVWSFDEQYAYCPSCAEIREVAALSTEKDD